MNRFFARTLLFLAFLAILMGTTMWILNGAEVGSLVNLVEQAMKSTGLNLGQIRVNI